MESLDRLSIEMSFFKEVQDKCMVPGADRLKGVLEDVFEDLMQYLIGIARIFFRSDGGESVAC